MMYRYKELLLLLAFACIVVSTPECQAQYQSQTAYSRLIETQQDYNKAVESGDSLEIAEMCYRLGKRYIGLNDFYQATKWLQRALKIRKPMGPSEDLGKVYSIMSECEGYQNNMAGHLEYVKLAIDNLGKSGSRRGMMISYRLLGGIYARTTEDLRQSPLTLSIKPSPDSAIYFFARSLEIARELNLPTDVALIYQSMANSWLVKKDFKRGADYFQKAAMIFDSIHKPAGVREAYLTAASSFLDQQSPAIAKSWIDSASKGSDSLQKSDVVSESFKMHLVRSRYYQQTGDWKRAFLYWEKYSKYVIYQRDAYKKNAVDGLTLLFENEKKELSIQHQKKELALLRKNENYQRRITLGILTACAIFMVAGYFFFHLYRKYRRLSHLNKELVKEQSHRIRNNLQSVADLIELHIFQLSDPASIYVLKESLSRVETISLIHRDLYNTDCQDAIEIHTFIPALVRKIISQLPNGIHVHFEIEDLLLHVDQAIPVCLIINELATNASKHAFNHHAEPELYVSLTLNDSWINLTFKDNGPGFDKGVHRNSFGIRIIELLTKKLKGKQAFKNEAGCTFTLSFPLSRKSKFGKIAKSKELNTGNYV
ncbi:sensor histidine kinase [Dyadobacter sp. CY347]|uniref:sensor histidine kinase n=1 Tax=Dyadobacter sp. CY347 TaxID=2909336 RepID=UPI001F4742FF|nr:sensor histidine kinase [Dyadobacter sp. CY347]MCF2489216.1 sensor histidine kinase [Dyadobacter sp. CY347]